MGNIVVLTIKGLKNVEKVWELGAKSVVVGITVFGLIFKLTTLKFRLMSLCLPMLKCLGDRKKTVVVSCFFSLNIFCSSFPLKRKVSW